jgi:transcriptional antiterminator NusG
MSDFNELTAGQKWYVVHTYTGHENKVKTTIERIVESKGLQDFIFDVKVPTMQVVTTDAKGNEKIVEEKVYPSYVFVKMILNDDTWHTIRYITGVTGFVGPGSKPVPLSEKEAQQLEGQEPVVVDALNVGDEVVITEGLFEGMTGVIGEIFKETGKVTVLITKGGIEIPCSLDAKSVEKKA